MTGSVPSRMTPSFEGSIDDLQEWIELHSFRQVASLLGEAIDRTVESVFDPYNPLDPSDAEDTVVNLLGMILVAAQAHMVTISAQNGLTKKVALGLGPTHPCGDPKVSLLNDLANFWKHVDEWDRANLKPHEARTNAVFRKVALPETTFYETFQAVLETEILDYSALERVLKDWRKAVDETKVRG